MSTEKSTNFKSCWKEFSKGILAQNPLLVLLLGACPALAVTTSLINGLGMGLASTFVLICSNVVISAIRNFIPEKVRIPSYITVIASFVTILHLFLQAYLPALNDSLGIFIPLITVNCIILGRAEAFASKNSVVLSAFDGLGMGLGFTLALVVIGGLREILGNGSLAGWQIPFIGGDNVLQPILIFIMPPGGFIIFGLVIALALHLSNRFYGKTPEQAVEAKTLREASCLNCLLAEKCPAAAIQTEEKAEEATERINCPGKVVDATEDARAEEPDLCSSESKSIETESTEERK